MIMRRKVSSSGPTASNPVTGAKMPIFAGNFVLMEYGTGAVMAVPTHDQRDFYFAKKFNLPLVVVIQPEGKPLDGRDHDGGLYGGRRPGQFRALQRDDERAGPGSHRPAPRGEEPGQKGRALPSAGLGDFPAAVLGGSDPDHLLPRLRDRSSSGKGSSRRASRRM